MGALDTGATYTVIPHQVALRLGYGPESIEERVTITTASSVEEAPLVTIDEMDFLGQVAKKVKAVIHDLPPEGRVEGLIGLSYLANFDLFLGYKEGVLRFG